MFLCTLSPSHCPQVIIVASQYHVTPSPSSCSCHRICKSEPFRLFSIILVVNARLVSAQYTLYSLGHHAEDQEVASKAELLRRRLKSVIFAQELRLSTFSSPEIPLSSAVSATHAHAFHRTELAAGVGKGVEASRASLHRLWSVSLVRARIVLGQLSVFESQARTIFDIGWLYVQRYGQDRYIYT